MLDQQVAELAKWIERLAPGDGVHATPIERLSLYRTSVPSEPDCVVYQPALAIVAQGCKSVLLGDEVYRYGPSDFLIVSVHLPVSSRIVQASPEAPFLALHIDLDPSTVSELLLEMEPLGAHDRPPSRGMAVSRIEAPVLDAVLRLIQLLDTPQDRGILAPLMLREITYRLLVGEQGARLRQAAAQDSQTQRISTAIHWLRQNFTEPLRIGTLARQVHLSASALHHQFKAVTAMSPLQYQKRLRLQEARRLMLTEALDAASAGHRVGYESPSQFSREYRRLFGAPPQADVASLRGTHRSLLAGLDGRYDASEDRPIASWSTTPSSGDPLAHARE